MTIRRGTISSNVYKNLFAHSGNCCAFDGCTNPIFEDDGTLTGECCHIEAASEKGPRFNPEQSTEERNGYDNLILLCSRHHKIIDSAPNTYTVDYLKELKNKHEKKFLANQLQLTSDMLKQLEFESKKYWNMLKSIELEDETGFKMELEEGDPYKLFNSIDETFGALKSILETVADSMNNLQTDLEKECEKCGINYSLFERIPYQENSLINRCWESVNLGFHNIPTSLELQYYQLCVILLEETIKYNDAYSDLLDKYRNKLKECHEGGYYID